MASSSSSESKTLTLVSSDGEHFEIPEAAAVLSVTLKNLVDDGCAGTPIPLSNVTGAVLTKVVEYLKQQADESVDAKEKKTAAEALFSVKLSDLFEYVLAANYLDIKEMLDLVAQKIADEIKHKTPEWIRKTFGIANDFSEEEEEKLRLENQWAYEGDEINDD